MKKKLLLVLCVSVCMGMVACGEEDVEPANPNSASPVVSQSTTASTVTPTVEPEQTPVVGDSAENEGFEDIIGDYDFDIANISIDDMVPAEIGVDIMVDTTEKDLPWSDAGLDGLTVLFPRAMYWTLQGADLSGHIFTIANNEDRSIEFKLLVNIREGAYKADAKCEVYDYGNYIVSVRNNDPRAGREGENLSSAGYAIAITNVALNTYTTITLNAGMNTENGVEVISAYREAFIADILAQMEARSEQ